MTIRYDTHQIKAQTTEEGYLRDVPIVGRVGVQVYKRGDGSIVRELRPPEEVFSKEALESFAGKPITDGHPDENVDALNVKKYAIGTVTSEGKQEGDNVVASIIIHDGDAVQKTTKGGVKELSLGYKVDLEDTKGVWNGQPYDAIQRNIKINHLAIVPRGRAGNARLNIDRLDAAAFFETEVNNTMEAKVKLDSGIEYPVPKEVEVEFERLKST